MKKIFLLLLLGSVFAIGCSKILVQTPQNYLDATTAFTTAGAIDAGLLGTYNAFQNAAYYGTDYTLLCDLEADNLDHTGSFPTYQEVKNRAINPDNTNTTGIWNQIYTGINRANNIIASASAIKDATFDSTAAIGEAKFLRAFMYFDLMRFFGGTPSGYSDPSGQGVPLVLTPTYTTVNAAPHARSSAGAVFTQILSDLDYSIANMPATSDEGRANTTVAMAMKARVELYLAQYDSAAALSEQVITQLGGGANGGLASSYASLYTLKNVQPESIFELQFSATNTNGLYFYYFGRDEVASSDSLLAAYDPADTRLPVNFFVGTDASGNSVNATTKYDLADGSNDIMLIRLSEMYLTHAESVIRSSNPDIVTAQNDLNIVRARAGVAPTTAATVADLETAILKENRLEFPHEAHRWFDLRRLGLAASMFGISDPTKVLWPIPQTEVLTSGGVITQNPGY
jgi:starch-binding outer membrane protein, SusD/RagB family